MASRKAGAVCDDSDGFDQKASMIKRRAAIECGAYALGT